MMKLLPYAVAAWVFIVGLYGIVTSRNLIHLVVCLLVVQSSTYVALLSVGYLRGGIAPILADKPAGLPMVDPVIHALALTDIVVGATVTALLLALVVEVHTHRGTIDPEHLKPEQQ